MATLAPLPSVKLCASEKTASLQLVAQVSSLLFNQHEPGFISIELCFKSAVVCAAFLLRSVLFQVSPSGRLSVERLPLKTWLPAPAGSFTLDKIELYSVTFFTRSHGSACRIASTLTSWLFKEYLNLCGDQLQQTGVHLM